VQNYEILLNKVGGPANQDVRRTFIDIVSSLFLELPECTAYILHRRGDYSMLL